MQILLSAFSGKLTHCVRNIFRTTATRRMDYQYERHGTANLFVMCQSLAGWREVKVMQVRQKVDFAHCMQDLDEAISERIAEAWQQRTDRYSEERSSRQRTEKVEMYHMGG